MASTSEREQLEDTFPGLQQLDYSITSPASKRYNCIAWAVGRDDVWMWPDKPPHSFWPDDAPREVSREAFVAAFGIYGFEPSGSEALDPEFEKIAIFEREGRPTHAARQLPKGEWTSKCGKAVDISHTLESLEGDVYGMVAVILQRERPPDAVA